MTLRPLDLVWQRVESGKSESTAGHFNALLYAAEAFLKTYTAAIIAGVPDERDRHRYRLCHRLVRATSIGDWVDVLGDVSIGPASTHLLPGAGLIQKELTDRHGEGSWVYESANLLNRALAVIIPDVEPLPKRVDGRRWFTLLVQFRNKTRGHGATTSDGVVRTVHDLETSLQLYWKNSVLTTLPWAYIRRNLSGKYHVVSLGTTSPLFEKLKGNRTDAFQDGVYVDLGSLCRVELLDTTLDATEFFYPNGHFRQKTCEWLSYISGTRKDVDGSQYLPPATPLPASATEGSRVLEVVGNCLANLPPRPSEYVVREELESELSDVLTDDRHPVITLVGRGGIGKTSLALEVLHRIAHDPSERFFRIVWLSARDIDLLPQGPRLVQPAALTPKDMARQFAALFQPAGWNDAGFNAENYLATNLNKPEAGDSLLLVFDNFETVQQPLEVFHWLDVNVRSPNKILITTRHRDFRGDYPVEVGGMTERQCNELVQRTASVVGISESITVDFCKDVYRESEGHPYVVKILVGEAADGKSIRRIERIVEGRDDLLDALFERTFKRLSPAAKHVFLTLSNWRSLVPLVALEAVCVRPNQPERIDVGTAIEELRRVSFLAEYRSPDHQGVFVGVPLVAGVFGKRKLSVSPEQSAIDEATRFLRRFGAMVALDVKHGLKPRVERFFASVSEDLSTSRVRLQDEMPVLELIARRYPVAWLMIADLWGESDGRESSAQIIEALSRYLQETVPGIGQQIAWERIAAVHRQNGNWQGFVNAQVKIAELPGADLATISAAVNTFNSVSRQLEGDVRSSFAQRLATVMEPKILEGDATDCSRLAWLLLRCGKEDRAAEIVDCGLKQDRGNEHCLKLNFKIWSRRAEEARRNNSLDSFVEAMSHLAKIPFVRFSEVSESANVFNQFGRDLEPDQDRRQSLARRIANFMEPRIGEGNATDCSRLAWVLIQAGENERAKEFVDRGLKLEANNEHCLKLKARLA